MTHLRLTIEEKVIFDGNAKLIDKSELQNLMFNVVARDMNKRIRVEISLTEEADEGTYK